MDFGECPGKFEVSTQDLAPTTSGAGNDGISAKYQLGWNWWKSRRFIVTIMGLLGFFNVYALRVSLSVAIVAMTQKVNVTLENGTVIQEQEFDWNSKEQGLVLSSFFYGYICTQLMGGLLAARFGGHIVFGIGIGGSSVLMMLSPLAAKWGIYPLIVARVVIGLFEGVVYPSIQDMYSRWAPIYERTTMSGIVYSGSHLGTFGSFLLSGLFAQYLGWSSIFYVFGGFGCVWFVLWMSFIKKDPSCDPRISPEEKLYIMSNLEGSPNHNNPRPPWKAIFTSSAVYALMTANTCDTWTNYTFLTQIPTFLDNVLKFNLGTTGILAASPYLVFLILTAVASPLSDFLRSRNILSTQNVRKIFIAIGFLVSGAFLVIMTNSFNFTIIIACLIGAIGATAFTRTSYLTNPLDLAPNYTSVVMGVSNTVGTIPGIVAPTLAGFITRNGTQDEWRIVFYISAGFCVLGTVVFAIFGKGSAQKWGISETNTRERRTSETSKVT